VCCNSSTHSEWFYSTGYKSVFVKVTDALGFIAVQNSMVNVTQ